MCVVVYYCSDIKICGEGGGAGGRAADQRGAGAAAAARHLGLQRADSKICSTDWNRLRVCRSALVETWPMLGLGPHAVLDRPLLRCQENLPHKYKGLKSLCNVHIKISFL